MDFPWGGGATHKNMPWEIGLRFLELVAESTEKPKKINDLEYKANMNYINSATALSTNSYLLSVSKISIECRLKENLHGPR